MAQATLAYRHNTAPNRGLAALGIIFIKALLAIPHLLITGALQSLSQVVAYIGFWVVAFTGKLPQATTRFLDITLGWTARTWGWIGGIDDAYPPFDTDPQYSIAVAIPPNEQPNTGWAVAGILLFPKVIAAIPHFIVMAFLTIAGVIAVWFGHFIVLFTGRYPTGLQDFAAGVIQWNLRVAAWFAGLTDEYPPFTLK